MMTVLLLQSHYMESLAAYAELLAVDLKASSSSGRGGDGGERRRGMRKDGHHPFTDISSPPMVRSVPTAVKSQANLEESMTLVSSLLDAIAEFEDSFWVVCILEYSADVFITTVGFFLFSSILDGLKDWRSDILGTFYNGIL